MRKRKYTPVVEVNNQQSSLPESELGVAENAVAENAVAEHGVAENEVADRKIRGRCKHKMDENRLLSAKLAKVFVDSVIPT